MSEHKTWAEKCEDFAQKSEAAGQKLAERPPMKWSTFWVLQSVFGVFALVLSVVTGGIAFPLWLVAFFYVIYSQKKSWTKWEAKQALQQQEQQPPVTYNGPWNINGI